MTDLETMERAKTYMEKLANGINPLDGTVIPEHEVVNNVRLSRCFFYVADVLRQVIENGGIHPKGNVSNSVRAFKERFALPVDKRNLFEFSEKPIPISEISKRINVLIDVENMKSLSYTAIREWLVSIEALEAVQLGDGRITMRPTHQGERLGISLENRVGQNGNYSVVVYDAAAQRFIVDNLDAICESDQYNKSNSGKVWSTEQDDRLADMYQKGVPINEIAIALKRNSGAVRKRLRFLGLFK